MVIFRNRSLHSKRIRKKRRRTLLVRSSLIVIVIVIVIVSGAWLAKRPEILIHNISVRGALQLDETDVRASVDSHLDGEYVWFFPKRNIFLYPKRAIQESLLDVSPMLKAVDISLETFQSIVVTLSERRPYARWCGTPLGSGVHGETTTTKQCYFIDREGVVFSDAPDFSFLSGEDETEAEALYFTFNGALQGERIRAEALYEKPLGFRILPADVFGGIATLKEEFEQFGIAPHGFHVREGGPSPGQSDGLRPREGGEYVFTLKNGVEILFAQGQKSSAIINEIDAAFQTDALSKEDLLSEETQLEYIDVRFENRIYYKFK